MSKVNVCFSLKNEKTKEEVLIKTKGILTDHKLIYKDLDETYEWQFIKDHILLQKKKDDISEMRFKFVENQADVIWMKSLEMNRILEIPFFVKKVKQKENRWEIDYEVEDQVFHLILECR